MNWRTSAVLGICERIRQTQDYSALPILADALQDAGYDDEATLTLLRNDLPEASAIRITSLIAGGRAEECVRWIEGFSESLGQPFMGVMNAAANWLEGRDTPDNSGGFKAAGWGGWPEFWERYEYLTGRRADRPTCPYSCSC